jgi:hypothetical protein
MAYRMSRSFVACLIGTLALLAARGVAAQTGGTGGIVTVSALTKADFTIYLQYELSKDNWVQMNTTEQSFYFNRARCECIDDQTDYTGYFRIAIQPAQTTADKIRQLLNQNMVGSGVARLYVGSNVANCLTPSPATAATFPSFCLNLLNPNDPNTGIDGGMATFGGTSRVWYSPPIPVAWLFNASQYPVCSGSACNDTSSCTSASSTVTIYFWAQTSSQQTPDMPDSTLNVNLVGQSSFVPDNVSVEPGNEALTVSWGWPGGISPAGNASFLGVQIFCVRGENYAVKPGAYSPAYMTAASTCKDVAPPASTGIDALDPDYLCSGLLPPTSNSFRITGLQNGIPYGVGVAAIDKYKNASVITYLKYDSPIPTVDFYTEYKNLGGAAQGGYCAVATSGRAPGLLAVAGLVVVGLWWWRRRKGGGAGPLALALFAPALLAGPARAETIYYDDMEEVQDQAPEVWRGSPREFAIEARFGLYTPNVDSEFSGSGTKPQAFIFGSSHRPMWQLEFDWELLQVFGTFAVGGVIGYYKENGRACMLADLDNAKGTCTRSGDNTSLRLIPIAALAIYRFDVLAEHWKIPLVPYGKLGLNYTLWSVTEGNGYTPSAGGGRGAGGTLGWQAAVGISLQLDFIDPSAARGFDTEAGVNHTYAFFELDHIDSSGLGSKGKLHVGDDTWFAGLMFEF